MPLGLVSSKLYNGDAKPKGFFLESFSLTSPKRDRTRTMTLLISTQSLYKSYTSTPLFSDISLSIFEHERLGLIGPNGSGKSTLLKIFSGIETPDEGKVVQNGSIKLVYLPQEDAFNPQDTLQDVLFGDSTETDPTEYQHRIRQVTGEALFPDLTRKAGALSGGWRKRLSIVKALLQNPDLLLMDEPTNHLDLEGILWLEALLKKSTFAFVLVTHDRYFLENTTNTVIELNKVFPEGYFKSSGNYSAFLDKKAQFIEAQIKKEQSLKNQVRREQTWLDRMPKARTTKAQFRIDRAEKLKADLSQIKASNAQTKKAGIDFAASNRKTRSLLEMEHVSLTRDGRCLFSDLNLKLSPGTCLGLMGKNGSGKSSLMNLLAGNLQPDSGRIDRADNLRIVMFDQKREQLNQQDTLMRALSPTGDNVFYKGNSIHVASWAKRFLFSADQLQQPVSRLSGGEQARILMANLMLQPADILLLDEPTNDLDIPTLEVLEDSLSEFTGALVLITHDRYLLDRLSDRLLYLSGDGKTEFFAEYAQWEQYIANAPSADQEEKTKLPQEKKPKQQSKDIQRKLNQLQTKIQKAEAALSDLEKQLEDTDVVSDPERLTAVCVQIESAKAEIDKLYQEWIILELPL